MSNEIQVRQDFSEADVTLMKDTICRGATDSELKLFLNQCKSTGLNPFARQIYAVKRWDQQLGREVMSTQVSIDGFRLIAERTGKYAGQEGPYWCGEDGKWTDVWTSPETPIAAKVGVLRHDFKEPCWGVARFKSYAQTKKGGEITHMWKKMDDVMIAKCAESLALRKAFPQELSGLYTKEEMDQAEPVVENAPKQVATPATPEPKIYRALEAKLEWQAKDAANEGCSALAAFLKTVPQDAKSRLIARIGKELRKTAEQVDLEKDAQEAGINNEPTTESPSGAP